ncbi:ATP-dependent DNA helicase RecG [Candidatus Kuenenbacteria bacterium RIFCSPHIGHO2_02_FULL_39_13]|uniref:ATP-dependent DNA helicase RecG n=1 Tax=Candidatus Kuenenbacteria bacterium RIFCSPHIGHO2_02_FULL_39_13 TaxID=1798561 RepID=A0A1F6FM10_9BACT|nr:MAG: ATP-dependent DNA helicase RecG [Candidatus Kuenenbacteria bacterium RIFCSPHIGHO2_02_FULL_39_13]
MTLNSKIETINGIAKRIAPKMKKLGVETVEELLNYFPFRWEDWSQVKKISEIMPNTTATINGVVELIQNKRSPWKKSLITEAIIADGSDKIKAVWFHQPYLVKNLRPGDQLFLSGKVELREDGLQFVHPQYERITRYKNETTHTARIVPIYPLTKGLTEKQLRYVMSSVISLTDNMPEWLPIDLLKKNNLNSLAEALRQIHFPDNNGRLNRALERLKFDELFLIQLRTALAKAELRKSRGVKIEFKESETKEFVSSLPFQLTNAQKIAGWEILKDMQRQMPMNRLLEGDVGSGKTVVAGLSILNAVLNKFQVAYMAPTGILARQHFETLTNLFKNWPINIGLLTSSEKMVNNGQDINNKQQKIYDLITNGKLDLVIGTHALIQDKVELKNLGLVIVDEQHRFGVEQRKKLKSQGRNKLVPHLLSMTATPIPRSLALTVYGDLDLSVINELPMGRKKTRTEVVPPEHRPEKYKFVLDKINNGEQVFVICPLIDPSDKLGVKAAKDEFEKLDKKIFPEIPIGLMHGKLKARDKERVMQDFLDKKTMIMVSTAVIEVGIDVPNATVIMIESAERFGLAQLHQLRGRVGRSEKQSYCFLFTESDAAETMKRLQAVVKSNDGFALAEADLEFRGPGEVYGIKQSGYRDELKVAKLTDYIIIKKSKTAADEIIKIDAELNKFPLIKSRLKKFEATVHWE